MANTKYLHPNVSAVLVESDVTVPQVFPITNLFCPIISEKGPDRKLEYVTSPEDFIFKFGYPNFLKYGQANYNAYNALKAGAGVYVLRCTPEYLDGSNNPVAGSATYSNIVIGVGFDLTSDPGDPEVYTLKPTIKYNTSAYDISDIESSLGKATIGAYTEYDFLALYPKGRGESYNNLGITLTPIQGRYADTYPWYMYSLTVYRNINGVTSKLESFIVSLDSDAKSVSGNSYFILDILESYSKYLVGSFNQTVWDSIETDIGISAYKLNIVNATPFKTDATFSYGKKVVGQPNQLEFYSDLDKIIVNYLTTTDTATNLGFINGAKRIPYLKYGYDGKYTVDGLVGGTQVPVELYKSDTFNKMMVKAFSGVYDFRVTQTNETEIDLVLDANFSLGSDSTTNVKQSMIDFSQQLRKDCLTILDLNTNNTQSDYLDIRQNHLISLNDNDELEEIPVDTRFVALISGDRFVFDDITKKNIQVTLTYYLSSLIPSNDKLYGLGKNFVGVNRSVITDYIDNKGSAYPTEPEKEELYNNQINYLTKTFKNLYFDSQETTVTKASAMGEISKSRAYLRMERIAKSVCNRTQWEFATDEVYKNLESSINSALESFVKDGTCEYIRPKVWADAYAKANKLVYVSVELRFTDIIERVEISFNVAR